MLSTSLLSQSCLLCPLALIRFPEQSHGQSANKTHVQQLSDIRSYSTVYWNLVIWPAIYLQCTGRQLELLFQRRNTGKMAEIFFSAHAVLLDSKDDLIVNLKKSATAFVTTHNEVCIKFHSRLYSQIPLPAFLGSSKEVQLSGNSFSSGYML